MYKTEGAVKDAFSSKSPLIRQWPTINQVVITVAVVDVQRRIKDT